MTVGFELIITGLKQFKARVSIKKAAYRSLPGTPRSFLDSPAHISH